VKRLSSMAAGAVVAGCFAATVVVVCALAVALMARGALR
jgi:hypothetical protein